MKPRPFLLLAVAAAAASTLAPSAASQAIQLRTGKILVGEVRRAHDEGITFARTDNGGVLDFTWDQLSAETALRLKKLFDLSVEEGGEVMVEAQVVRYALPSGAVTEMVGHAAGGDDSTLVLRSKGQSVPIPRRSIRSLGTRQVVATDLYTKDELYQLKLAEMAPGDDADKHILLADLLVRLRDYERAEQHLKRAEELGNSKQPGVLRAKLQRVALYKSSAGESGLLEQIQVSRRRQEFEKGRALLAEFAKKYPNSKLQAEVDRERQRFEEARERYLVGKVAESWYQLIPSLAKSKVQEASLTLSAARDYAESTLGQEIRKRIAQRYNIQPDEVNSLWEKRLSTQVGRSHLYHYGVGSWVLGEKAVLKDTKQSEAEKQGGGQKGPQDEKAQRMERKIQEALERAQRAQARARDDSQKEETDEDWWRKAKKDEQAMWLRAYYAEHSGDLKLESAHVTACPMCSAAGYLETLGQSGGTQRLECFLCKRTRYQRYFRAR
jgi:hypothetical protein